MFSTLRYTADSTKEAVCIEQASNPPGQSHGQQHSACNHCRAKKVCPCIFLRFHPPSEHHWLCIGFEFISSKKESMRASPHVAPISQSCPSAYDVQCGSGIFSRTMAMSNVTHSLDVLGRTTVMGTGRRPERATDVARKASNACSRSLRRPKARNDEGLHNHLKTRKSHAALHTRRARQFRPRLPHRHPWTCLVP